VARLRRIFWIFPLARCIALHKNRYSIEYGATVARLRRIFWIFPLLPWSRMAPQAVFKGVKFMHITLNSPGL
jgi:hypothetical protein